MSNRAQIARDVSVIVALLVAAVTLALADHGELAATALGGALGIAMPGVRNAPVPGVVIGLGLASVVALQGCGGSVDLAAIKRTTCHAAETACALLETACTAGGER